MYNETVMEHFRNPRNIGIIENADSVVQVGDPSCGDSLLLFLKIENDVITDIKVQDLWLRGCNSNLIHGNGDGQRENSR